MGLEFNYFGNDKFQFTSDKGTHKADQLNGILINVCIISSLKMS